MELGSENQDSMKVSHRCLEAALFLDPEFHLDPHLGGKGADRQVIFHVVPGAFHIDLLLSRKFRADLIKHCGTSRKIPGLLGLEDLAETLALRTNFS